MQTKLKRKELKFIKKVSHLKQKIKKAKLHSLVRMLSIQKQSSDVFCKKKGFLKIFKISQKNTCVGVSFPPVDMINTGSKSELVPRIHIPILSFLFRILFLRY